MATEHEHWLEQGDIYALGALDGQELKDFEAHLASGCAICEAYIRETRESLLLLHRAITPFEPSSAVKTRVSDQIADGEKVVPITAATLKGSRIWLRMAGTIAAGIVGVVITAAYYHYHYEPRHSVYSAVIDLLRDPNTRDVALYGAGPTPAALGRFLWNKSAKDIFSSRTCRRLRQVKCTPSGPSLKSRRRSTLRAFALTPKAWAGCILTRLRATNPYKLSPSLSSPPARRQRRQARWC